MFNMTGKRVVVALTLMVFMFLGGAAVAQAGTNTHGADRTVKGAVAGAAVGTVTQMVRGKKQGKELLKGAAVGAAAGAAIGAYSDYRQEKNAREEDQQYYRGGYYRDGSYQNRYYRAPRPASRRR